MTATPETRIVIGVAVLAVAAAGALALGAGRPPARDVAARAYHGLTGGLGMGPAVDLARCTRAFDPRLAPSCDDRAGALPGTGFTCPHRSGVAFFPEGGGR